ncbi:hypothetical protein [Escherichia coli]|uniref:hypothetical protein n=1 Tax=Escherichia coli TaxID=562 RepID=UPI000E21A69D|nr:hypothetical protein [Escherichia coli]
MNRKVTVLVEKIEPRSYDTHQVIEHSKIYMVRYDGKMIGTRHFNSLTNNPRVVNNDAVYVNLTVAKKASDKMNKMHRTDKFAVWCYDGQISFEVNWN